MDPQGTLKWSLSGHSIFYEIILCKILQSKPIEGDFRVPQYENFVSIWDFLLNETDKGLIYFIAV